MKIKSVKFVKSVSESGQFPLDPKPEIAFLGRSNVGKSSLINSLVGTRGLARTSSTPGRTQLLNFFLINESFYLVDLPGYGYARAPVEIKKTWGAMVERYLATGPNLILSVVIVDLRHDPSVLDRQMVGWLKEIGKPFAIVGTKSDKLSNNQLRTQIKKASSILETDQIFPFSAITRTGADGIWREIAKRLKP